MSVDYYVCDCCKQARYSEYIGSCTKCGNSLCTRCVVNDDVQSDYAFEYGVHYDGSDGQRKEYGIEQDKWEPKIGDIIDDTDIQPKYCPFCNGDEVSEDDILDFALSLLEMSKEDLIRRFKESK